MVRKKYCVYPVCLNNTQRSDESVKYFPFPKPKRQAIKCAKWLQICEKTCPPSDVKAHWFVCSKHFSGENGPTDSNPYPLPVANIAVSSNNSHFMSINLNVASTNLKTGVDDLCRTFNRDAIRPNDTTVDNSKSEPSVNKEDNASRSIVQNCNKASSPIVRNDNTESSAIGDNDATVIKPCDYNGTLTCRTINDMKRPCVFYSDVRVKKLCVHDDNMEKGLSVQDDDTMETLRVSRDGFMRNPVSQNGIIINPVSQDGFMINPVSQKGFITNPVSPDGFMTNPVSQNGLMTNLVSEDGFMTNPVSQNGIIINPVS